jgi:ABC-type branched-subunit amino acid transport system ATPase component
MELYEHLSVRENVELGLEARIAGQRPLGVLAGTRRERVAVRRAADEAMARCGIGELAEQRAGALSSGQRRLVELARALAGGFRILLLDEPSSGLDTAETDGFGRIVRAAVGEGIGVLLVEHDMALVRAICERVYVLDFGRIVESGQVGHVLASPVVRAVYLGEGEVA